MAACGPGSIADQYLAQLSAAAAYFFQNGDLFIDMQDAAGRMRFSAPSGQSGGEGPDGNIPALHRTWGWQKRVILDSGQEEQIGDPSKYTLTFSADGSYQFQADCNSGGGSYVADERGAIRLQPGPVTLAECGPDSRSQDMLNMMQAVQDYRLEEDGATLVMVWPAGGQEDYYRW
jgi:heat shock protein HslJ